jgi:hypothetical protein
VKEGMMSLEENSLYVQVSERYEWFKGESKKHKRLTRILWLASSITSLLIAFGTNFSFTVFDSISSHKISAGLALALPLLTAYVVLRTPEKLWILETSFRNRLGDLRTRIRFAAEKNTNFNRDAFEKEVFEILTEANQKWVDVKQGSG